MLANENDMTDTRLDPTMHSSEIDLFEVGAVLIRGWPRILGTTVLATFVAVAIALAMPDVYRAQVVLAPADESGSDLGPLAGGGALASLAGLSLGLDQGVDKTELALEILRSRRFFADFAERHDVLVPLFAGESWDASTDELVIDPDVYDVESGRWVRDSKSGRGPAPSMLEGHEAFHELLDVSREGAGSFVVLSLEHLSPQVAHDWLRWLIEDLNERIRGEDIREAEKSIGYLRLQVEQTEISDLRAVLFELIQSQTEKMVLAQVRDEYAFKTIDPPVVPEKKSGPHRTLICLVGAMLGGVLGVIWVLLANAFRSSRS